MVLSISSTKGQHRFDNLSKPFITASGLVSAGRLLVHDQFSTIIGNGGGNGYIWNPLNRTEKKAVVKVLDSYVPSWTRTAGVSFVPATNGLKKTTADGFDAGAYMPGIVGDLGIEALVPNTIYSTAISLQSGVISYNWLDPNIEHCLIFGEGGAGSIRELGEFKTVFTYQAFDVGIILREADIVKYYLVRSGKLILLRSIRSRLAAAAQQVVSLYHTNSQLDVCSVWQGIKAQTTVDVYGILRGEDYEDWRNPGGWESLAEKTMTKSKQEDFTYYTDEKNLMTLSLGLEWREENEYLAFRDFFQHHDLSREFIYVSTARSRLLLNPQIGLKENELFSKFVSSFKDNPLGAGYFGVSVDIRQMIDPPILIV